MESSEKGLSKEVKDLETQVLQFYGKSKVNVSVVNNDTKEVYVNFLSDLRKHQQKQKVLSKKLEEKKEREKEIRKAFNEFRKKHFAIEDKEIARKISDLDRSAEIVSNYSHRLPIIIVS